MSASPDPYQNLEPLIHRTLRELPLRRAPRSLGQRVLAELERRAALPWWRKSFVHWPVVARAAFVVVCAALATLVFQAGLWMVNGFDPTQLKQAFAQPYALLEGGVAIGNAIVDFCDVLLRAIPPLWLYGGLALFAAMYATLFGIGAAAYRVLHVRQ